jgi:hypothetical protein
VAIWANAARTRAISLVRRVDVATDEPARLRERRDRRRAAAEERIADGLARLAERADELTQALRRLAPFVMSLVSRRRPDDIYEVRRILRRVCAPVGNAAPLTVVGSF